MLSEIGYNRFAATRYAVRWAFSRNPRFYDFEDIGGDCTNYISQCLYAGCKVMNYSADNGWYYLSSYDRAPAWTGVDFFREFILTNEGAAVYGEETSLDRIEAGDVIQLIDRYGNYYHTVFVSAAAKPAVADNIFVCAHTVDSFNRRLSTYNYSEISAIHILGARKEIITQPFQIF